MLPRLLIGVTEVQEVDWTRAATGLVIWAHQYLGVALFMKCDFWVKAVHFLFMKCGFWVWAVHFLSISFLIY
jgi:hypothetical protein